MRWVPEAQDRRDGGRGRGGQAARAVARSGSVVPAVDGTARRFEYTMTVTRIATAISAVATRRTVLWWVPTAYFTTLGAISNETRFITLISGLMAGPAVSLKGSPTVSPMTVA